MWDNIVGGQVLGCATTCDACEDLVLAVRVVYMRRAGRLTIWHRRVCVWARVRAPTERGAWRECRNAKLRWWGDPGGRINNRACDRVFRTRRPATRRVKHDAARKKRVGGEHVKRVGGEHVRW